MGLIFLIVALILAFLAAAGQTQWGVGTVHLSLFPASFFFFLCSVLCGSNWWWPKRPG